jgi:ribosomal protein L11 methyltransferase
LPGRARTRTWPAVCVAGGDPDLVLVTVDDFGPTAVEPHGHDVRVFFATFATRDLALAALLTAGFSAEPLDVADEDWAQRSQESLRPVTVERITITPPWHADTAAPDDGSAHITIVVLPSMGFGTGHHATTRLCLRALQWLDLTNCSMLDVGTGSGVLALAASRLGAARALGVDYDPDAVQSASDNLDLNPDVRTTRFEIADLFSSALPAADVVTANLTGAFLVRAAERLLDLVQPGGSLIVSGLLGEERDQVVRSLAAAAIAWEQVEEGWVALILKRT